MLRRVVVTGLGAVTPFGMGAGALWDGVVAGRGATVAVDKVASLCAGSPCSSGGSSGDGDGLVIPPVSAVGPVLVDEAELTACMDRGTAARSSRFIQMAVAAADEALQDAGWAPEVGSRDAERTGVAVGSGMGSLSDISEATRVLYDPGRGARRISPFFIPRVLVNLAAGAISIHYGLQGPNHAVATACATGAHAVGDAANMIAMGYADVMVAGSTEASMDPLALTGFARARALSTGFASEPSKASRPFSATRDGFVMSEGAGILVLEDEEHARARGATIYARVGGYGMSADAHHITSPSPDGRGARAALTQAMERAGLAPHDVGYVNAHATSTPLGDGIEYKAIVDVVGAQRTEGPSPLAPLAVSSSKGALGHLLGASGSVEAIVSVLALSNGVAPPTANLEDDDPELNDANVQLVKGHGGVAIDAGKAVLSNSFGFGGTNVTLAFTP